MTMMIKCKICGGNVEVIEGATIGTCLYCGSTMTLPRIESEKKARLFNRAHQYRLNCEFDKAYDAYKAIVDEDEQEAEAYWGMLLSEYGVEYVDDPKTKKKMPTCHRTHIQSVLEQTNYLLAHKYADIESRFIYQDEAEELDRIQKRILSVSTKEEPFDVFICYKESDGNERTADSVLAQEIYENLTEKGVRVFFSRITLEDKAGLDYEPYIYSALNSARIMLMVSTSGESCESVWVKNEWMRFLRMMEENKDKVFIPVIKDLSPYELPNAFSKFQVQDFSKIGAMQDLQHGVLKILGQERKQGNNDWAVKELMRDKEKRDVRKNRIKGIAVGAALAIIMLVVGFCGFQVLRRTVFWHGESYDSDFKIEEYLIDEDEYGVYRVPLNIGIAKYFLKTKVVCDISTGEDMVILTSNIYDKGYIIWVDSSSDYKIEVTFSDGFRIDTDSIGRDIRHLKMFASKDCRITDAKGVLSVSRLDNPNIEVEYRKEYRHLRYPYAGNHTVTSSAKWGYNVEENPY